MGVRERRWLEQRVGIVLLDAANDRNRLEYFLRQEFDCLDARYNNLPVNFTTGMPLASTPLFRDALAALEWEVHAIGRAQWLSFDALAVSGIQDSEIIPD